MHRSVQVATTHVREWCSAARPSLSPPPEASPLERLRACGDVDTAAGDIDDLPEPLVLPPGVERPSTVLARLRRDER